MAKTQTATNIIGERDLYTIFGFMMTMYQLNECKKKSIVI